DRKTVDIARPKAGPHRGPRLSPPACDAEGELAASSLEGSADIERGAGPIVKRGHREDVVVNALAERRPFAWLGGDSRDCCKNKNDNSNGDVHEDFRWRPVSLAPAELSTDTPPRIHLGT